MRALPKARFALATAALLQAAAPAQEPAATRDRPSDAAGTAALPPPIKDPHLDRLVGDWVGQFESRGTKFEGTFSCAWVLNGQFLRMAQRLWGGGTTFEAVWFWRPAKGGYGCWVFDSYGTQNSVRGNLEGEEFVMTGQDPQGTPFRSISRFVGRDEVVVLEESGPDGAGKYRKTSEGMYQRAKAGAAPPPGPPAASGPALGGDDWLDGLVGSWSGAETIEGAARPIEKTFEAAWTLDRQFLLVRFVARPDPAKPPFEALGLWRGDATNRRYSAGMFDAGGEVSVFTGRVDGTTLSLESNDPKYGLRRTLLTRKAPGELVIAREVDPERDGTFRRASEAVYRRK